MEERRDGRGREEVQSEEAEKRDRAKDSQCLSSASRIHWIVVMGVRGVVSGQMSGTICWLQSLSSQLPLKFSGSNWALPAHPSDRATKRSEGAADEGEREGR